MIRRWRRKWIVAAVDRVRNKGDYFLYQDRR
jgi:hypothetical protein